MRKPVKLFLGVVFMFIMLLLCLRWPPREMQPPRELASLPSPSRPKPLTVPTAHDDRISSLHMPYENPLQVAMLWSNAFPEQAIRYAAVVSSINAPVYYFGLCMDQDGKPLAGVNITMRIRQWQGISPIDLKGVALRFPRTSDPNGRFELVGVKADVATVESASLAGYEWIRSALPSIDFSVPQNRIPNPGPP